MTLFSKALELSEGERAAYLARECENDEGLRQRVEGLLDAYQHAGTFMEVGGAVPAESIEVKVGDWIGPYKVLQSIGEGGCGVVFMASQEEPIRRQVALKVIKPGMDSKLVIARFEAERQALAMMDHPNIAKVLDAGACKNGRPFFVMELVRGIKLTTYCDQHGLSTNERLELFMQVCQAVEHAHQKGIIHRDLKPSNILVTLGADAKPMPKVIDFGIAKATTGLQLTEKTLYTAYEALIGTPAYMSPEQAALTSVDVDTRTDIYSLGVLLYELLTGSIPFDTIELLKSGFDEVRRVIRTTEPERPSERLATMPEARLAQVALSRRSHPVRLLRAIRGDLDWIVTKALEKNRDARYQTAGAFAEDVRRHLRNEPIAAGPPSNWNWFWKLVQRHRLAFALAAGVAGLLVTTLAIIAVALGREHAARQDAEQSRQQAEKQKKHAQAEAARSAQVTEFLEEMLQSVGPSVALGRDTTLLKEILDKTADRLESALANQPAIEADLRTRLGVIYSDLGEHEKAEAMYRRALAIRVKLTGEESAETAEVLNVLSRALCLERKAGEAEVVARKALKIRERLYGRESVKVAESLANVGAVCWQQDRLTEAEEALREALRLYRTLLDANDSSQGEAQVGLGSVLFKQRRFQEAAEFYQEAASTWERKWGPDHPAAIGAIQNLAVALEEQGKFSEAEPLLWRVVSTRRKVLGENHPAMANSLYLLADCLARLGRYPEADRYFQEALKAGEKKPNGTDDDFILTMVQMVRALNQQGKFDEVERRLANLLPPGRPLNPKHLDLLRERCESYARAGRWREARADAQLILNQDPKDHLSYHTLAPLLAETGEQEDYARLCRGILERFGGTNEINVADRMAKDCVIVPVPGLDLRPLERMADLAVSKGADAPGAAFFQVCKAMTAYRLGDYEQGAEWAGRAAANPFPYSAAEAYAILSMAQVKLGKVDAARASLALGNSVAELKLPKPGAPDLGGDWRDWIIARKWLGEARTLLEGTGK